MDVGVEEFDDVFFADVGQHFDVLFAYRRFKISAGGTKAHQKG